MKHPRPYDSWRYSHLFNLENETILARMGPIFPTSLGGHSQWRVFQLGRGNKRDKQALRPQSQSQSLSIGLEA